MQFPGGKAAVCEGEIKSFGAMFIKAKGKKVAVFKKGGCLGTSSIIGLNKSDEDSAQGLQWPASLPQVRHPISVELLLRLEGLAWSMARHIGSWTVHVADVD